MLKTKISYLVDLVNGDINCEINDSISQIEGPYVRCFNFNNANHMSLNILLQNELENIYCDKSTGISSRIVLGQLQNNIKYDDLADTMIYLQKTFPEDFI